MALEALPALSMTRRSRMWDRYYGRFGPLERDANLDRCLRVLSADEAVQTLNPDQARIRREFRGGPRSYARLFGLIHQHHAESRGKARWGEQLKWIERFADGVFEAFPSARMIHMVRDPLARFGEASERSRGSKLNGALGRQTAAWLRSVALAERNERRYPGRYRVVRFEALSGDPAGVVQALCSFVAEDYVPAVEAAVASLEFDARPQRGAPLDAAFIDRYAKPSLVALGYATGSSSPLPRGSRIPSMVHWPINRAAMRASDFFDARAFAGRLRR